MDGALGRSIIPVIYIGRRLVHVRFQFVASQGIHWYPTHSFEIVCKSLHCPMGRFASKFVTCRHVLLPRG